MKNIVLMIILCSNIAFSQCVFQDIYPFKTGNTKFDITKILNNSNNKLICVDTHTLNNEWTTFDYLDEKVYKTVINLKNSESCLESIDNHIQLCLINDYLYRTDIEIEYNEKQFQLMLQKYDEILDLIPDEYKYTTKFISKNKLKEKVGEGVTFNLDSHEKDSKIKINEISVGYIIKYESIYDENSKSFKETSKVKFYKIEINIVDLRETVLTNQGF